MSRRSKAIVLSLFLGGLGIHKFYLNKPIQGIIYLLFCWTFIPAFVAIIEAIRYAVMGEEKFNRSYPALNLPFSDANRSSLHTPEIQ